MEKLTFTIDIKASATKTYNKMLGIDNKSSYEEWTKIFNPTSTFQGSWDKGSKMYFIGIDENGQKGGMVSEIEENLPNEFVSICHNGFLNGDTEITTGPDVEKWAGGHEDYRFSENNGVTTVIVELDTVEEYKEYFASKWPEALLKLKEITE